MKIEVARCVFQKCHVRRIPGLPHCMNGFMVNGRNILPSGRNRFSEIDLPFVSKRRDIVVCILSCIIDIVLNDKTWDAVAACFFGLLCGETAGIGCRHPLRESFIGGQNIALRTGSYLFSLPIRSRAIFSS